ncbi:tungstate/molybdate transport system ATP-binding protein [Thermodesulforhabdus norvegica]|uniref:Tungstate/molybdate transport system ATP-binding protein n=2 Tax=Thermodesulforhabdus norvegica TaxID=39841 RepID=A0A1I4S476_9BACT|nr:tungstate/molybdate transport system ATP-binding protein [Thermodesulforhabdus norvegica]
MGPTGAGKTLVLEAIAGLVPVTSGRVLINDRDVTKLPPEKRGISIVYQDQALFPHLTVKENIEYGLKFRDRDVKSTTSYVARLVEKLGIRHLLHRKPVNLSGGEKQRVALARALAVRPSLLLMDEPLSALDPSFRDEMGMLLKDIWEYTGATFIMVTHDFTEALSLGTRGAVMNKGGLEQVGNLWDIFQRPATVFVAHFVGMRNVFDARFDGTHAFINGLLIQPPKPEDRKIGKLAFRPELIRIVPRLDSSVAQINVFSGTVTSCAKKGFTCEITVKVSSVQFTVHVPMAMALNMGISEGQYITVVIPPEAIHIF